MAGPGAPDPDRLRPDEPRASGTVSTRGYGPLSIHIVVMLAILAYSAGLSFASPVLPSLQIALHTNARNVVWIVTSTLLSASILTPVVGRLGDALGRRRVMLVVLAVMTVGSLVSALAPGLGVMLVGRVLQGAGGGVLPLAFGIVRDELPWERVSTAISSISALLAVGGGMGALLAGPIVSSVGYRFLFWLPMIISVVAGVLAMVVLPRRRTERPARLVSVRSVALFGTYLVALLLVVSEGSTWGWTSLPTLGLLASAVLLAPVWVRSEMRSRTPLVDIAVMRLRPVWTSNLAAFLVGATLFTTWTFLPEFAQAPAGSHYGFGVSVQGSGLFLLPMTVTMSLAGVVTGVLSRRFAARAFVVVGAIVMVSSFVLFLLAHASRWVVYLFSGALGIGIGLGVAAISVVIVTQVAANHLGSASGMNANIRILGGSVGTAVFGGLIGSGSSATGLPRESAYLHGFIFLLIASVLALVVACVMPREHSGRTARIESTPTAVGRGSP